MIHQKVIENFFHTFNLNPTKKNISSPMESVQLGVESYNSDSYKEYEPSKRRIRDDIERIVSYVDILINTYTKLPEEKQEEWKSKVFEILTTVDNLGIPDTHKYKLLSFESRDYLIDSIQRITSAVVFASKTQTRFSSPRTIIMSTN